jgi:AcrR family transcriptional regulator
MSAPQKTSVRGIRAAARIILEEQGLESVSMQAVATAVGVKPPSLYKHFTDRADLLRAVREEALAELQRAVDKSVRPGSAYENLERMATAYRTFAKKNPVAYQLIFSAEAPSDEADRRARAASAATLLKLLTEAIGLERALPGARTLVAFLHGFVLMESSGLFRLGGDINQAFKFGVTTILDALLSGTKS